MDWLAYFQYNRAHRMRIPWERGIAVEAHLREPLIRSLQRFQVGEKGDGAHLKQGASATGDAKYAQTISLFIEEEQEHSQVLGKLIHGMGGTLIDSHCSDVCFVLMRRLMGLRLELMILLVAEMIAKRYYRALYEGTSDVVLRSAFAQISHDELGHVAFHCDTLQRSFVSLPGVARRLIKMGWCFVYRCVCLVVMFNHRTVLRAVGVTPRKFWRDCGAIFDEDAAHIFQSDYTFLAVEAFHQDAMT